MVDFSLWDIFRNLLLAARWTVLLSVGVRALLNWLGPRFIFGRGGARG